MKILLVDDHALTRDGLALVVEKLEKGIELIQADDASSAITAASDHPDLDLVLLDYHIPGNTAFQTLEKIKGQLPATPVAIISAEENAELIREGLRIGASGFLTKNSSSEVILNAIKLVLSGGLYVPPAILNKSSALNDVASNSSPANVHFDKKENTSMLELGNLTDRQKEVLRLMDQGLSNKEIAKHFDLSPSTVKVHVAAILREYNAENRTQAVSIARRYNLVPKEPNGDENA